MSKTKQYHLDGTRVRTVDGEVLRFKKERLATEHATTDLRTSMRRISLQAVQPGSKADKIRFILNKALGEIQALDN